MNERLRVFISGPYTHGDVAANVRRAIDYADALVGAGYSPFCPHLSHFWHLIAPMEYEGWIEYDLEWLKLCHAVLRIPGHSPGADRECALAGEVGIPVFLTIPALRAWAANRTAPAGASNTARSLITHAERSDG